MAAAGKKGMPAWLDEKIRRTTRKRNVPQGAPRTTQTQKGEGPRASEMVRLPNGSLMDPLHFKELNAQQVHVANHIFHSDPLIGVVSEIALSALLEGGVLFQHEGKYIENTVAEQYAEVWRHFIRDLVQSWWMYGFAAVKVDTDSPGPGIPRVIDLKEVRVRLHRDYMKRTTYLFYEHANEGSGFFQQVLSGVTGPAGLDADENMLERRILGVMVFEMHSPTAAGDLRSLVLKLRAEHAVIAHNRQAQLIASARMANPALILEHLPQKDNPDNRSWAQNMMILNGSGEGGGMRQLTAKQRASRLHTLLEVRALNTGQPVNQDDPFNLLQPTNSEAVTDIPIVPRARLPPETKLARQNAAAEPRLWGEVVAGYQELVGATFGVPRAFFAQFTSGRSSNSPEAQTMFRNSQNALKAYVLPVLRTMYQYVFSDHLALEAVATATTVDYEQVRKAMEVTVSLPGVPDQEFLRQLWVDGALKYSSYIAHAAAVYGMPHSDFNPQPQMTLKDLNGVKDEGQGDGAQTDDTKVGQDSVQTTRKDTKKSGPTGTTTTKEVTTITSKAKAVQALGGNKKRKADAGSSSSQKRQK